MFIIVKDRTLITLGGVALGLYFGFQVVGHLSFQYYTEVVGTVAHQWMDVIYVLHIVRVMPTKYIKNRPNASCPLFQYQTTV